MAEKEGACERAARAIFNPDEGSHPSCGGKDKKESLATKKLQGCFFWRRKRDLNPRDTFAPYSLSRGAPSPLGYFSIVFSCLHHQRVAERVGFEPTDARASPVFKTGAFNRSAISPQCAHLLYHTFADLSTDTFQYAPTSSEY